MLKSIFKTDEQRIADLSEEEQIEEAMRRSLAEQEQQEPQRSIEELEIANRFMERAEKVEKKEKRPHIVEDDSEVDQNTAEDEEEDDAFQKAIALSKAEEEKRQQKQSPVRKKRVQARDKKNQGEDADLRKAIALSKKEALRQEKQQKITKEKPVEEKSLTTHTDHTEDEIAKAIALSLEAQTEVTENNVPASLLKARQIAFDNLALICNFLSVNESTFDNLKKEYLNVAKDSPINTSQFEKTDMAKFAEAFLNLEEEQKELVKENLKQQLADVGESLNNQVGVLNSLIVASTKGFSDFLKPIKKKMDNALEQAIQTSLKDASALQKEKEESTTITSNQTEDPSPVPTGSIIVPQVPSQDSASTDINVLKLRQALAWSSVRGDEAQQPYLDLLAKFAVEERFIILQKYLRSTPQCSLPGFSAHLRLQESQPKPVTFAFNEIKATTTSTQKEEGAKSKPEEKAQTSPKNLIL
ncbi:MAG: hypothetical protein BGO43_11260 [Gammaproteobacteria bacterium 39-13]|nr:hypothetical protein [Gammaproteobacteria bacterium]OJV85214.1 MAG: hypothetical protein BGO43_11260 [Gammaproteobacteria bacterium 39-13]